MMPLNEQQIQKLEFIVTKMGNKIANEFEPTRYDINERYQTHKDTLVELSKFYMSI